MLRCRLMEKLMEVTQSLELYGLDPAIKLKPPRAQVEPSDRTFESSNYRLLVDAVKGSTWKDKTCHRGSFCVPWKNS